MGNVSVTAQCEQCGKQRRGETYGFYTKDNLSELGDAEHISIATPKIQVTTLFQDPVSVFICYRCMRKQRFNSVLWLLGFMVVGVALGLLVGEANGGGGIAGVASVLLFAAVYFLVHGFYARRDIGDRLAQKVREHSGRAWTRREYAELVEKLHTSR